MSKPGALHGFSIIGSAGWGQAAGGEQPMGLAVATALWLHGLDRSNTVRLHARVGQDPRSRPLLRHLQNHSIDLSHLVASEVIQTWSGAGTPPEPVDHSLIRWKSSTGCIVVEADAEDFSSFSPMAADLRQSGLKTCLSAPTGVLNGATSLMKSMDYALIGPCAVELDPADIARQAISAGVFLTAIAYGVNGVARVGRGQKPGEPQRWSWPAPTDVFQPAVRPAMTAAFLHSLAQGFDPQHTAELVVASGWLGHAHHFNDPIPNMVDALGQALRAKLQQNTLANLTN